MTDESYSHGILGHWAVIGHGFNIASIASSLFVVVAVVTTCIYDRTLYNSPSFRLSAWIAVCDIIYSACQLCVFENAYMSSLSEMHLRVIHWLMSASTMSFVFMSACVALDALLRVTMSKGHIARRIQPWYEYVSLFLGFILTHPILYIYKMLQWSSRAQIFHIYDEPIYYEITSWLTKWAWLFSACVFMFFALVHTVYKLYMATRDTRKQSTYSEYIYDSGDMSYMSLGYNSKRKIRSVTIRSMLYPTVPILTQIWVLSANMSAECPMWLYVMANLVPATQGMINFLVFTLNPAWDNIRRKRAEKKKASVHISEFSTLKGSSIGSSHLDLEVGCDLSRPATLKS